MKTSSYDATEVVRILNDLVQEADGNVPAAAKRLGVERVTLWRWLHKPLGIRTLKDLSRSKTDPKLVAAARKAIGERPSPTFDYGHIAAQLIPAGPPACLLLESVKQGASEEDCEWAAVHDLAYAFGSLWDRNALCIVAEDGLTYLPNHPLGRVGTADYEAALYPDEASHQPTAVDQSDTTLVGSANGLPIHPDRIEEAVNRINQLYQRRHDMTDQLIECVRREPLHRLYDLLHSSLVCVYADRRDTSVRQFSKPECRRIAALAATDAYVLNLTLISAADTVRSNALKDRRLEECALYAISAKIFEICHSNSSYVESRVEAFYARCQDEPTLTDRIQGMCEYAHHRFGTDKSTYMMSMQDMSSVALNAHGSFIDRGNDRPSIVSRTGDKRKAPKSAVTRGTRAEKRKTAHGK